MVADLLVLVEQVVLPIAFVQDRLGLLSGFLSIAPLLLATYSALAVQLTASQRKKK